MVEFKLREWEPNYGWATCRSCQEEEICVDLGQYSWICTSCLAPMAKKLAAGIDKALLNKILDGAIKLP